MTLDDDADAIEVLAVEMHERYARALPAGRKREIAQKLVEIAVERGAVSMVDCIDWLDAPELGFLVRLLGLDFPLPDDDFVNALQALFFSRGRSRDYVLDHTPRRGRCVDCSLFRPRVTKKVKVLIEDAPLHRPPTSHHG